MSASVQTTMSPRACWVPIRRTVPLPPLRGKCTTRNRGNLRADPSAGDLTELAGAVGLSPGHLSRLFKAQTGTSLSRYRNQQRLHRFLLAYGSGQPTTALAAALAAGFGSYAQFYRVFRQATGRAPAALPDQTKNDSLGPAPSSIGVRSCRAR